MLLIQNTNYSPILKCRPPQTYFQSLPYLNLKATRAMLSAAYGWSPSKTSTSRKLRSVWVILLRGSCFDLPWRHLDVSELMHKEKNANCCFYCKDSSYARSLEMFFGASARKRSSNKVINTSQYSNHVVVQFSFWVVSFCINQRNCHPLRFDQEISNIVTKSIEKQCFLFDFLDLSY